MRLLLFILLATNLSAPAPAFAQDGPPSDLVPPTQPAPPSGGDNIIAAPWQVGDPCKDYKTTATPQSQRFEYCAAAEQAEKAAKKDGISWKIWAGVAAVCGTYCVSNWICASSAGADFGTSCSVAAYTQIACTIGNVGATVNDFMANKELGANAMGLIGVVSSVSSLGTSFGAIGVGNAGAGAQIAADANGKAAADFYETGQQGPVQDVMTNEQGADKVKSNAQAEMKNQDTGDKLMACAPFILATITTVTKQASEKDQKSKAKENKELASKLKSSTQLTAINAKSPGSGAVVSAAGGGGVTSLGPNGEAKVDPITQACDTAANTFSTLPSVQCALASDRRLGPGIGLPKFQDDFKKITGADLSSFLANAQNPGQAIGSGMANSIGAGKAAEMAAAVNSISADTLLAGDDDYSGGSYAGGGGGGRRGGGGGGDPTKEFANLMQGLMGQMTGEEGADRKPASVSQLEFKMSQMKPEEVEGARDISLFDRVAIRYQKTKPRLVQQGWAVPFNRASNGQQ